MSDDLDKKVEGLSVDEKNAPKPHPQPETIYESFVSDLKAFFDSVDGRVKLIHETFNQIALGNGKPPPPPQFISFLLDLTEDQIKSAGTEGPVVTYDQFILAVKRTIFENETKADFETKFLVHIKSSTVRMLHAKKLIKEIRPDLTKFHEKVEGDSDKLFDWFKEMVPADVKDQVTKEYFLCAVMRNPPDSAKVPLEDFIFGLEANLDETDSADKILAVCSKF